MNTNTIEIPDRLINVAVFGKKPASILEKHKTLEKEINPSPYLISIAMELETFKQRYSDNKLPIRTISNLISEGEFKTGHDGELDADSKWEVLIDPSFGSHLIASQEIKILREKGILNLKKIKGDHHKEFYPIHFNLGIEPDFPSISYSRPSDRVPRREWEDFRMSNDASPTTAVVDMSDCFLLGRMFDATGWATSRERLLTPYNTRLSEYGEYLSYRNQGISGIRARSSDLTQHNEPVVEIRTGEIWGSDSLRDFQRYLKTIQVVGAALKAYQKIPLENRDMILSADTVGNTMRAENIIKNHDWFDLPHDQELALLWIKLRREVRNSFASKGLSEPMKTYYKDDFINLAYGLPSGKDSRKKKYRFMYNMRQILTNYRGKVVSIIENT